MSGFISSATWESLSDFLGTTRGGLQQMRQVSLGRAASCLPSSNVKTQRQEQQHLIWGEYRISSIRPRRPRAGDNISI